MARFTVLSDLSQSEQDEINRISAIASAQRTSHEANYITARSQYLTNGIDLEDADGNIIMAQGYTLPTGLAGFAKSAIFRKTNVATGTHAHTLVTATTNTNTTQVVEYITAGVIGNGAVATTETLSAGSWGDTTLAGGVDGTVGDKGQQYIGTSYIYTAIADNTIADKNWRRVALGSAY